MPYTPPTLSLTEMQRAAGLLARVTNTSIPAGNTVTATTETAFASKASFAPGLLATPGTLIQHRIWGRYSSTGLTPTITPRIRLGGVELFPTRLIMGLLASNNVAWQADSEFLVTDSGIVSKGWLLIDDNQIRTFGGPPVTGIDLSQALDLTQSAQWGQSGCSITLQGMTIDVVRPT